MVLSNKRDVYLLIARLVDFIVISLTFHVSNSLLSMNLENGHIFLYSGVILISVCLGKLILSRLYSSSSNVVRLNLGNATGFFIGVCMMSIAQFVIPELRGFIAVVILACVMAFFVLGTLAPLLKLERPIS